METAHRSMPLWGDKLYQRRARDAMPLLVRQAIAGKTCYYSDLARELGMPNPRNLNYVLGCIGRTLGSGRLGRMGLPPLQCLVINRHTGLPGEGVGWFLQRSERRSFSQLSKREKRNRVQRELSRVFDFRGWLRVLEELNLRPASLDASMAIIPNRVGGEPESPEHIRLKQYVASHPEAVGQPRGTPGRLEYPLPSGDLLDVSFRGEMAWTAIEVKSLRSSEDDIKRGLYQCVKYLAVMAAVAHVLGSRVVCASILVLERELPARLVPLKNILGVQVLENVRGSWR